MSATYIVKKNNRRIPNKVFESYEKARQWVRKKVRSLRVGSRPGFFKHVDDYNDAYYRTPTLLSHGYSISRVEG
jgi:hypothetical protein